MIYFICSITITLKINIYHWFNLIYQIKWILYVCVSSRHLIRRNNNVTLLTAQYCWVFPPYRPSIDPYVVSRCPFLIKARDTLFKAEKVDLIKRKQLIKYSDLTSLIKILQSISVPWVQWSSSLKIVDRCSGF